MNRKDAAKYARWSALVAFGLAGITGVVYVHRIWVAHREKQNAPAPLPQDEEKQLTSLHFKKVEGNRTIFDLEASKSTDLKGQDISLLQDVKIVVFGKTGDRHDVIHTQSCRYAKADSGIQCEGAVQFELQSAAEAERAAGDPAAKPNVIHIETSGVTFERATGRAQTAQPVKFTFPNGSGEGVGAVYQSDEGRLRLVSDVHLQLTPVLANTGKRGKVSTGPVELRGASLEMGKAEHTVQLLGPATATTTSEELSAGEFTLLLDAEFRARTLLATAGAGNQLPKMVGRGEKGSSMLQAEKLTAELAPQGWISGIVAEGQVRASSATGNLQAETGELEMWPQVNQAKLLTLKGNVRVDSRDAKTHLLRSVTSNALQLSFSGGKAGDANRVQHAETLERGTMDWTDASAVHSKLSADKLALDFSAKGKAQLLNATGGVQSQREAPGRPLQTASAANGVAQLSPAGDWQQITLRGNVKLQEADRVAESQQAVFAHTAQTVVLTGQAVVRDSGSETHAPKITFFESTGEIEAEGPVRSTDFAASASALQLSNGAANISADRLHANSKTRRAVYTGHARLWQGPSVLEALSIELLRETRVLHAVGNVRAVFPQSSQGGKAPAETPVWHVSSGELTYWDAENRAHLEKDVFVQSADQRMRAPQLDLYFTRTPPGKNGASGASEISRAVGSGGVVVEQGDRRGTAETSLYTAADQKFVLTGGIPTLFDPVEGTTTGRELTFYRADDTIVVDSGNGLRTLTRHRIQR